MNTVLKRVFANPRVTPGVVLALLLVSLVAVPRALDAAEARRAHREFEQAKTWTTDRWTFTTADFASHDTAEVPVEPTWLIRSRPDEWQVEPVRTTGISPLFHSAFEVAGAWLPDATTGISGTRVDGVDVYSYVSTPSGPGFDTAAGARNIWDLQEEASMAASFLLDPGDDWAQLHHVDLLSVGYVGAPAGPLWVETHGHEPFDAGGPGYFGVTTHQRGDDGAEFRTTTIATVVEGSLAVVGVVVPDGVEPAADLEPALLLERLSEEVRADPPSHVAPDEGDGTRALVAAAG